MGFGYRSYAGFDDFKGAHTVAIYDKITTNDQALFIAGAAASEGGGVSRLAPMSAMTVVHEFGHLAGWSAGAGTSPKVQAEFNAKFADAKAKLKAAPPTWYAASAPSTECVPEALAIYNADPEWMSSNLPDLYAGFEAFAKMGTVPPCVKAHAPPTPASGSGQGPRGRASRRDATSAR